MLAVRWVQWDVLLVVASRQPVSQICACSVIDDLCATWDARLIFLCVLLAPVYSIALQPSLYTRKSLPLPLPAHSWHPRYNGQFDAIGQLPPVTSLAAGEAR